MTNGSGITADEYTLIVYAADNAVSAVLDLTQLSENEVIYEAYGSTFVLPQEKRFADINSMQMYVDKVLKLRWVKRKWPDLVTIPIEVRAKKRGFWERASYERRDGKATILIPPHLQGGKNSWAMRELILLHEVAHHFAKGVHGEDFIAVLVEFIGELIGPVAALIYQIEISKARDEILSRKK